MSKVRELTGELVDLIVIQPTVTDLVMDKETIYYIVSFLAPDELERFIQYIKSKKVEC